MLLRVVQVTMFLNASVILSAQVLRVCRWLWWWACVHTHTHTYSGTDRHIHTHTDVGCSHARCDAHTCKTVLNVPRGVPHIWSRPLEYAGYTCVCVFVFVSSIRIQNIHIHVYNMIPARAKRCWMCCLACRFLPASAYLFEYTFYKCMNTM